MPDDIIDLRSVNWSQGMFLTPDHFLRQERYFDSALLWLMRHAMANAGLVGGGPRVEAAERGAARFDPIVDIDDSGDTVKVTVTQCRGLTEGGALVDVDPTAPVTAAFSKGELAGVKEFGVYVIAKPHDKEAAEGIEDPINADLQVGRRARYRISLDPPAEEAPWSLLLVRMRRAEQGTRFERAASFIPPCAFMSSHSELMHWFRRLNERVAESADRYSELHRAIVEFIGMARGRDLQVDQDLETLAFVSRMVVTLEECAYAVLDPLQPPRQFFQQMNRLIRSAALFLSLSPPTREYFRLLGEIGETEFTSMLSQEGEALEMGRRWSLGQDLGGEVQKIVRALDRLDRLEQALEGKYMDYRISPSIESINFFFDRTAAENVLYQSIARPTRPQAQGQELTFVFAQLRIRQETREQYRLILVGDKKARFSLGDELTTELRINHGEGYKRAPDFVVSRCDREGQRNFAVDFSTPTDVVSLSDLRASLRSSQPIQSAILYVRTRFFSRPGARPVQVRDRDRDRDEPVAPRSHDPVLRERPVRPPAGPEPEPSLDRPSKRRGPYLKDS